MAEVLLENVSRVFPGGVLAVDRMTLAVRDGEFLVLVGPSGCGKSTTLRMIAGLEQPSSGQIHIGGKRVNDVASKDRDIAMVFQSYALFPHLSVADNLAFGLKLRSGGSWLERTIRRVLSPGQRAAMAKSRGEIAQAVEQAADSVGIRSLLDRMPRELSGGERQRVALGRAMARRPAAFLFDEPLSNLDAPLRIQMRRELKQWRQRVAATVVHVTHDQVEALALGDRIAVMDRGVLQQVGPPLEVYERPRNRFVAGFIGAPPMSFVEGALRSEGGKATFHRGDWSLELAASGAEMTALPAKNVVLGVRAEDVRLGPPKPGARPAVVTLVEPLGDATLVSLAAPAGETAQASSGAPAGFDLQCKTAPGVEWRVGQVVGFELNFRRLHFFERQTGERL